MLTFQASGYIIFVVLKLKGMKYIIKIEELAQTILGIGVLYFYPFSLAGGGGSSFSFHRI